MGQSDQIQYLSLLRNQRSISLSLTRRLAIRKWFNQSRWTSLTSLSHPQETMYAIIWTQSSTSDFEEMKYSQRSFHL